MVVGGSCKTIVVVFGRKRVYRLKRCEERKEEDLEGGSEEVDSDFFGGERVALGEVKRKSKNLTAGLFMDAASERDNNN